MTLGEAVLQKARSHESIRYPSPPPELVDDTAKKFKNRVNKFAHVMSRVDTSPPRMDASTKLRWFMEGRKRAIEVGRDNLKLLLQIRKIQLCGGEVDSHWTKMPQELKVYYDKRKNFIDRINKENEDIHQMLNATSPKVVSTKELLSDWARNRHEIISKSQKPFILFPIQLKDTCEDPAFKAQAGVIRPRVSLELKTRGGSVFGALRLELFTDVCPQTCSLFLDLLAGDGLGFGYVGTTFFRKVPRLYWSGGDVVHNNGLGCYAQKGRAYPIGAENYHFSHSMPGLVSMRVTKDDEMCGIFNITFKALPQFDLHSVVFGRVLRPSSTWCAMAELGSPLSSEPRIILSRARYQAQGSWTDGVPNTRMYSAKELFNKLQ